MVEADTIGNLVPEAVAENQFKYYNADGDLTIDRKIGTSYIKTDSKGNTGFIYRNGFHQQEYYPQWIKENLSFTGTLLPPNAVNQGTEKVPYWVLGSFGYGYVDNAENRNREACSFDIGWAVDENRQPVKLPGADFIRVYTALNQQCGWIGETSTEITGAEDLHFQE